MCFHPLGGVQRRFCLDGAVFVTVYTVSVFVFFCEMFDLLLLLAHKRLLLEAVAILPVYPLSCRLWWWEFPV